MLAGYLLHKLPPGRSPERLRWLFLFALSVDGWDMTFLDIV